MNCPQCGAPLVDMTIHGGPLDLLCMRGHRLSEMPPPEPEAPPESPKFLDRAAQALKSVFSRSTRHHG